VYIEQSQAASAPSTIATPRPSNYWYYCTNPDGYYPYIKQCGSGWQKVAPTPSTQ
jgi:hypothetical protein